MTRFSTKIIGWMTYVISRIRNLMGIRISSKESPVKINLGCGLAVHEGWINVDGSLNAMVGSLPNIFYGLAYRFTGASAYYSLKEYRELMKRNTFFFADLSLGIPASDNSVDFLYSSHFLEHLHPWDAKHLLNESYRVLKPNGIIRISVPDLEYAFKMYQEGFKRESLDKYFFVNQSGNYYSSHKYMYDFEILSGLLAECGFRSVERLSFREGKVPDICYLDNREEETLFVESIK